MLSETVTGTANFLQSCIPLLSLTAYLPQWQKIIRSRSSRDISLRSWLIWSLSSAIAVFYAVVQYHNTGHGSALVFSSTALMVFVFITIYLVAVHRRGGGADG
ncbi:MAG: PQ-loop domain-containing transporter [Halioglobus sp.]